MGGGFKRRKIPRELILDPLPRKRRWWLWLPVIVGLTAASFFAVSAVAGPLDAGTGKLLFRNEDGRVDAALHLDTRYETLVTGIVATTTLTQSFENTSRDWREAVYVFPLPETAAVHDMQIKVGDRLITAEIREREQAKKAYAAARAAGKVAALTEQERPNLFTQSLANIAPGATIEVTIRFIQVIDYKDGRFTLRLPLTLTPRYIPGRRADVEIAHRSNARGWAVPTNEVRDAHRITPFMALRPKHGSHRATVAVRLKPGLALASVTSPYHDITTRRDQGTYVVSLRDDKVSMDRDFVLEWRPTDNARPRAAFFGEQVDGSDYGLLLLMPPVIDKVMPLPREVTFVIDTSGSMKGVSIRQARLALKDALKHLRFEDRFNIVAFNSDYQTLFPQPRRADSATLDRGERFVEQLYANGGTEMRAPLEAVLSQPETNGYLKQVIFITDGAVGNETALFRLIDRKLDRARLFTVGIGSAPNSFFMRKAAQFGRGAFVHIGATGEVRDKIAALIDKIDKPVSRSIEVTWPASTAVASFPARLPALYASEPLIVLARGSVLEGEAVVTGVSKHLDWRQSVPVTMDNEESGIVTLWARASVDNLLDSKIMGADEDDVREQVVKLGLNHRLVTPYTSFVAVERWVSRRPGESLSREEVSNQVAKGQQVARVMMPRTGTHSPLAFAVGLLALMLAGWIKWRGGRACV